MVVVAVVLIVAVVAGWLRGGRLRRLGAVTFRGGWLLGVALAAQLAGGQWPALVVAQVAPLAFAWLNRALPGMRLVLAGVALNAAVILANGGMPVAGGSVTADGRHRALRSGDHLATLADVVALRPLGVVVSAGDLVLAAGVAVLVVALMLRLPAQPVERGGEPVAQ